MNARRVKIAWLMQFALHAPYWRPLFQELSRLFPKTKVYCCTPRKPGNAGGSVGIPTASRPPIKDPVFSFVGKAHTYAIRNPDMSLKRVLILLPLGVFARLAAFRPHIVFSNGFSLWTLGCLLLRPLLGFRLGIVYDGSSASADARDRKARLLYRRIIAARVDAFITNSRGGASYLTTVLFAAKEKVFTRIYLAPDAAGLSRFPRAPARESTARESTARPVFLYVGRVMRMKGIDTLLDACAQLLTRGFPAFSTIVVGGGREAAKFHERARALGLDGIVRWAGWVDHARLAPYYLSADVFVFPTFGDVWGVAPLEAMSFSKPVICSTLAGVSELVVEGQNGFLFDPHDSTALADAMERFVTDTSLARRMGSRSGERMAGVNPVTAAEGLRDVMELLERGL